MEGTIAEIRLFAAPFQPRNWAYCDGRVLAISSNSALFSLLGTTYGGNGQTTFGLPDFRGRVNVGTGQGQGLSYYSEGEMAGYPSVTLLSVNLPSHTHVGTIGNAYQLGINSEGEEADPTGSYPATNGANIFTNTVAGKSGVAASNLTVGIAGNNSPQNVQQPYLGMNYIICLYGIYPSRN